MGTNRLSCSPCQAFLILDFDVEACLAILRFYPAIQLFGVATLVDRNCYLGLIFHALIPHPTCLCISLWRRAFGMPFIFLFKIFNIFVRIFFSYSSSISITTSLSLIIYLDFLFS